ALVHERDEAVYGDLR
nr:PA28=regulators of the 20 S proteasome {peptide 11} [cattle, heart, Peptide Partial, 15 aa] [Bos taurus]